MIEGFELRPIRENETEQAITIEHICFPPNEACSREAMTERILHAADFFLVAIDTKTGKLAGFFNGVATNEARFRDEFFTDIRLHNPAGERLMMIGLDVLPAYRGRGLALALVQEYIRREHSRGRREMILTCLDEKVAMYEKMGFTDLGYANSRWGDEAWHEMRYLITPTV